MKFRPLDSCTLLALCVLPFASAGPEPARGATLQDSGEAQMAEMMAKMARYTQPGEEHALLERFLGKWDIEVRFTMGASVSAPAIGSAECRWLHPGRWIETQWSAPMMGAEIEGTSIMGYDKFKMSYVATSVSTMDTAMNRVEGDLNQAGDVLLLYGTIDEYLDGQHDKMSKTVYRFLGQDKIVMEVHDFTIGEENTKVVEVTYKRAK